MSDVNFVKPDLTSWKPKLNWVREVYENRRYELDHKLKNFKGISYEEKLGGSGAEESYRRSCVIDEINELEETLRLCMEDIKKCEKLMKQLPQEYQDLFRYIFEKGNTYESAAIKFHYTDKQYVARIIDRETSKLIPK